MVSKFSLFFDVGFLASIILGFLAVYYSYLPLFAVVSAGIFLIALIRPILAINFLVFYLPFQTALNILPGIDLASIRVLILIVFVAVILFLLTKKRTQYTFESFSITRFAFFLFLFLLWGAASLFWADNAIWGVRKLAVFISIFPLYFLTANIISAKDQIKKIIYLLISGGAILSFISIAQFFSQFFFGLEPVLNFWANNIAPFFYGRTFAQAVLANSSWLVNISGHTYFRAIAFFPDPHMLAFYLEFILFLALALLIFEKTTVSQKIFLAISFVLMVVSLFLTFSRGGYLGFIFGLIVIISVRFFLNNKISEIKIKSKHHIFILSAVLFGVLILFFTPVGERFVESFSLEEGSNIQRFQTWQTAAGVIFSNSFFGVGLGNYALAVNSDASYRDPIYAHNTYLDIWAELGVIGLFIWLVMFYDVLGRLFKIVLRQDKNFAVSIGLIGSLSAFGAHSFFDTAIFSPVILSLLMIIFGLAIKIDYLKD